MLKHAGFGVWWYLGSVRATVHDPTYPLMSISWFVPYGLMADNAENLHQHDGVVVNSYMGFCQGSITIL